jgi:NodT family efflux transporter outer membrane factor (OMF) lipoprotein
MTYRLINRLVVLLGTTTLLLGCQTSFLSPDIKASLASEPETLSPSISNWASSFNDPNLDQFIELTVNQNFDIRLSAARMAAAKQQAIISGATRKPEASIGSTGQRQKQSTSQYSESYSASLEVSWEADLWGKLSDQAQSGLFSFKSEQQNHNDVRLSVAASVARQWFEAISQKQLTILLKQRIDNLTQSLDIIQSGYRQGINSALDLYLARSDLASETSQLHSQQNSLSQAIRSLQILLGQFPDGKLESLSDSINLPLLSSPLPADIDSDVVYHRPDVKAAFYTLQAADRDVAIAYKARFPSFKITASGGDSSDEFKLLFDQSSLAWSILGGLSQPLFSGGRLKAQQHKRQFELQQQEQLYVKTLHDAYFELFTRINNETSLQQQHQQLILAKDNAESAQALAFSEYKQGLRDYTTVLESQRRAFSAQTNVINVHNQLLQNRVNIFLAMGIEY